MIISKENSAEYGEIRRVGILAFSMGPEMKMTDLISERSGSRVHCIKTVGFPG